MQNDSLFQNESLCHLAISKKLFPFQNFQNKNFKIPPTRYPSLADMLLNFGSRSDVPTAVAGRRRLHPQPIRNLKFQISENSANGNF